VLTLNQIVSQITTLATAHNQIAESGVGDFAEWQAKERNYPILWVFHESTSVNQMEIAFSIRLICADRVIVGEEGDDTQGHEQEVISDTLLVLLDFLAYFQQNHSQPYDVVTSATIDPFTERLNDRLAGNSVTITIRQPFDWNKCQIPQTGATIPPTVDGLTLYNFCDPAVIARLTDEQVACLIAQYNEPCEDATITINSAPFASVVSGGSLNVSVLQNGNPVGSKVGSDWVIPPCADGTVNITNTDSDPIASVTVASGGVEQYVIPNVSWTDSDGSAESTPYGDAIVCTPPSPVTYPTTALPMKTGQVVSYASGDDGDIQAGRDVDWFTLAENNHFGNTNRFTDTLGGQTYANNVMIDWSTFEKSTGRVLMWSRVRFGPSTWTVAIAAATSYSIGAFANWRVPNRTELRSLAYLKQSNVLAYSPFNSVATNCWTSNTLESSPTQAWVCFLTIGGAETTITKPNSREYHIVRTGNISEL